MIALLSRKPSVGAPSFDSHSSTQGGLSLPQPKVVLVVDDDPSLLKGVERLLRAHGFESVLLESADALQRHHDFNRVCCIVLDINLNDESGIEVRHQLRASGISVPVIFITGKDNPATRMAALESGCIAYLRKPFPASALIEPIEMASAMRT